MIVIMEYQTVGVPLYDEHDQYCIGYDCIDRDIAIVPEDHLDSWYDPENIRSTRTICEVQTIGM